MTHRELMRRIGPREYWQVCRIINEEAGPPPHGHAQSAEGRKQCAECREWHRNFERIWEEVFGPLLEDKGQKYTENGGVVPYKKNTKEETALYARVAKRLRLKVSYVTSVARGWQKSAPVSEAIEEERTRQRLLTGDKWCSALVAGLRAEECIERIGKGINRDPYRYFLAPSEG